jgi:hypothetical protein
MKQRKQPSIRTVENLFSVFSWLRQDGNILHCDPCRQFFHVKALQKQGNQKISSSLHKLEEEAQKLREKNSLAYKLCAMLMRFVGINKDALQRFTALVELQQEIFKVSFL